MSNKQIPQERWVEFFDQFTNGNRGRLLKLEIVDQEMGDETPISNVPLWTLVYDPIGKGNDLVIETGQNEVNYAHTVLAPKAVWERQDSNGKVTALEILDDSDNQTILHLQ